MTNANATRLGQVNQSGDAKAIFLKKFSGEVRAIFERKNIMKPLHEVKTIENGKSAQFPIFGNQSAEYHTPGNQLLGDKVNHAEKVINIEDKLVTHNFIADIDELMNHYPVRDKYTMKAAEALATTFDTNVMRAIALGARASTIVTGGNGGSVLTNAAYATTASTLATGIFTAAQKFDEKDVPDSDRYCVLKPAQYYLLAQNTDVINKDWGGAGAYSDGTVLKIAGITILKSNNVPTADDSADTSVPSTLRADFSNTVGLIFHKEAAATVQLADLRQEMQYDATRQGTFLISSMIVGQDFLRPECSIELTTA